MARVKKKKKPLITVSIVIALCFVAGVAGFFGYMNLMGRAIDSSADDSETVAVSIPMGTDTSGIADILKDQGLIRSEHAFMLQSRLSGYDGKYKAGQYDLKPSMTSLDMMRLIVSGHTNASRVTIPEGYTLAKIQNRLAEKNLINEQLFQQELENGQFNYEFLADAPQGANRLEGYLYPETYDFYSLANEHEIIDRMLQQFDKVFTEEYRQKAKELGLNYNEVLTIASIIQGEAAKTDEMSTISSVIYNRLNLNMTLGMDSTIQYVLDEHTDRVLYSHTKTDSPYNTYKNKGLPPGPICSPGIKAIEAALYPADTDYVYFVAKGDGYHAFSKDYDTFLKNKKKYIQKTFGE